VVACPAGRHDRHSPAAHHRGHHKPLPLLRSTCLLHSYPTSFCFLFSSHAPLPLHPTGRSSPCSPPPQPQPFPWRAATIPRASMPSHRAYWAPPFVPPSGLRSQGVRGSPAVVNAATDPVALATRDATATAAVRAVAALAPGGGSSGGVRRRAWRLRRRWALVGVLPVAAVDGFSGHGGERHRRCSVMIVVVALSRGDGAYSGARGSSRSQPRQQPAAAGPGHGGGGVGASGSWRRHWWQRWGFPPPRSFLHWPPALTLEPLATGSALWWRPCWRSLLVFFFCHTKERVWWGRFLSGHIRLRHRCRLQYRVPFPSEGSYVLIAPLPPYKGHTPRRNERSLRTFFVAHSQTKRAFPSHMFCRPIALVPLILAISFPACSLCCCHLAASFCALSRNMFSGSVWLGKPSVRFSVLAS